MAPAKSKPAPKSGKRSVAERPPPEPVPSEKATRISKKAKPNMEASPSNKVSKRLEAAMESEDLEALSAALKEAEKAGVSAESIERAQAVLEVLAPKEPEVPAPKEAPPVTTMWAPIPAVPSTASPPSVIFSSVPITTAASPGSSRRDASPAALAMSESPSGVKSLPLPSDSNAETPRSQKGSAVDSVDDLSHAFSGFENILVTAVKDAEQRVAEAVQKKAELARIAVELSERAQRRDVSDESTHGVEGLRSAIEVAKATAANVSGQLESTAADRAKWIEEREEIQQAVDKHFATVRDGATVFVNGTFERSTDVKHVSALEPLFKRMGFEESLIEAFPSAAARMPAARTDFMHTVIRQVDTLFKERIAALNGRLEASDTTFAEREAAVVEAREAAVAAEARLTEALEGSDAARSARLSAEAAAKAESDAATAAASAAAAAIPALEVELEAARRSAASFAAGPAQALKAWCAQHAS